jgi:hypothetical protein
MALVVEDGTGLTTSNGYATVAEVTTYLTNRGWEGVEPSGGLAWEDLSSTAQGELIVEASTYIDDRWGAYMRGIRYSEDQAMEFPRADAYDNRGSAIEGVPTKLKDATAEYVYSRVQAQEPLAPDPEYNAGNRRVVEEEKEAGGGPAPKVRKRVRYTEGGSSAPYRSYPRADAKMRELIVPGGVTR